MDADHYFGQFEEFLKKLKVHFRALKKQVILLIVTQQNKMDLDKQVIQVMNKFEERTNQFVDNVIRNDPKSSQVTH